MVGENPTPYGILALWAVNGLSIIYWVHSGIVIPTRWQLLLGANYVHALYDSDTDRLSLYIRLSDFCRGSSFQVCCNPPPPRSNFNHLRTTL